jgi:hypothetical protein
VSKFWEDYWLVTPSQWAGPWQNWRRRETIQRIVRIDMDIASAGTRWVDDMENVYRVRVDPNSCDVEVACLGLENIDSEAEGIYRSADELPEWMRRKLAVLNLMKVDPPQTKVEGVGMRISEDVFWIIKGE